MKKEGDGKFLITKDRGGEGGNPSPGTIKKRPGRRRAFLLLRGKRGGGRGFGD